jgi:DNA-binding NarL/FixJ family response regulator
VESTIRSVKCEGIVREIRVILADDHTILREALKQILESFGSFKVVAEATNGQQAVDMTLAAKPDVVVMDVGMPILNGIDSTTRIIELAPQTKVLVLSMHDDLAIMVEAFRAGASGYMLKSEPDEELVRAIRSIHNGCVFFSRTVAGMILENLANGTSGPKLEKGSLLLVQLELLDLLRRGCSDEAIASTLRTSVEAINFHRLDIIGRLQASAMDEWLSVPSGSAVG